MACFSLKSFLICSLRWGSLGHGFYLNSVGERTRKGGIPKVSQGLRPEAGMDGIDVLVGALELGSERKSICPFSSVS